LWIPVNTTTIPIANPMKLMNSVLLTLKEAVLLLAEYSVLSIMEAVILALRGSTNT